MGKQKKQKKQQNKNSIHGMVLTVVFIALIFAILLFNNIKLQKEANALAIKSLTEVTNDYARDLNTRSDMIFAQLSQSVYHMSTLNLKETSEEDRALSIEALMASGTMDGLWVVANGVHGSDEAGNPINLDELSIVPELSDHGVSICKYNDETKILFCVSSQDISGMPFSLIGIIDSSTFSDLVTKSDFDATAILLLVGTNGDIWSQAANKSNLIASENLWDVLPSTAETTKLKNCIENNKAGSCRAMLPGHSDSQLIIAEPISDTGVLFVSILGQSVVDKSAYSFWATSKKMIVTFYVLLVIFILLHIINGTALRKENSQNTKELQDKADKDLLTGLYNKIATERKIKEYMEENPSAPCMMLLIDVDDFKRINDTKGHAFGDTVLKELGMGLGGLFRYTDIVGRIGGDEFMVFLKNIENEEIMYHEAEKIIKFFDDFKAGTEYIKYSATASIGAASYPSEGADFDALYKAADKALYKSKANGKKQLNFHNEEMHTVKA